MSSPIPFSYPREATLVELSQIRIKDDRTDFNRMMTKEELKDKALNYLASYRKDMDSLQADRTKWLDYYY